MREAPVGDRLLDEDAVASLVLPDLAGVEFAHPLIESGRDFRSLLRSVQFDAAGHPPVVPDLPVVVGVFLVPVRADPARHGHILAVPARATARHGGPRRSARSRRQPIDAALAQALRLATPPGTAGAISATSALREHSTDPTPPRTRRPSGTGRTPCQIPQRIPSIRPQDGTPPPPAVPPILVLVSAVRLL